ncbi:MAG: SDR family oxidoreductase [Sedimentisphaerales bacterium]|nr:SDR family oxidoreductase [Sedimentisphaerales bacterium]
MDKALAELIRISNNTGKDPALVQGGGGNTSVKTADGKYMFIKASGTALKDMDGKRGWRRMRLDAVLDVIRDEAIAGLDARRRETEVMNRLLLACDDDMDDNARPSVEAHLHAFLDTAVIHLHPNVVGAYVNAKNGKILLERLFRQEKKPPLWVPYTDPGFMLARTISKRVQAYQVEHGCKPAILFLEKHGLFVTAPTSNAALRLVRKVIKTCSNRLKNPLPHRIREIDRDVIDRTKLTIRKAVFQATGQYLPIHRFQDHEIAWFIMQKDAAGMLAAGALSPDELVYANGPALWIDKVEPDRIAARLISQKEKGDKPALAFLVKNQGLFVAARENVAKTIRDIAAGSFFIRVNARSLGGIAILSQRQRTFINEWEMESFRRALVEGVSRGDLKDRIAVVTGAGSGLGRSIAVGLAQAGAMVALLDIDSLAAAETSQTITREILKASTVVCHCDVTSEESVASTFEGILDTFGGLDILVNAAGVAPPYPLVDLPVGKWRQALEVNLTGYFLMAKYAARIMIDQGMGGSIVNLSSKSGLEASKNNTPYNATKAGEIHMARGWALELGQHGIRVNSVCPGNVFEGSKIWNPQYIRVCAKKYGIKPDEVIPYYVSKTALNKEIKGRDIADAIVFLCSDRARRITGQTLVADAGQVMVR